VARNIKSDKKDQVWKSEHGTPNPKLFPQLFWYEKNTFLIKGRLFALFCHLVHTLSNYIIIMFMLELME
jgi:hypothetical protein